MVYMRLNKVKSKITLWKIYTWFVFVLLLSQVSDIRSGDRPVLMGLDLAVSTVAWIALFGFAYQKALLRSPIWKIWLLGYIAWDISYSTFFADWSFLADKPPSVIAIISIITIAFVGPWYYAQYLYAFRSTLLWKGELPQQDTPREDENINDSIGVQNTPNARTHTDRQHPNPLDNENFISVYQPCDTMQAGLVQGVLDKNNITCYVNNENGSSIRFGGMGTGAASMMVMVPKSQLEEALRLISEIGIK